MAESNRNRIRRITEKAISGKKRRKDWFEQHRIDSLYKEYANEISTIISTDELRVNKFLPTLRTIIPSLFLSSPTFIVRSKNESVDPRTILSAQLAEAGLQAVAKRDRNLEFATRLALIQAFFTVGVIKVSYNPQMMDNPQKGDPIFETSPSGEPILGEGFQPIPLLDPETGEPMVEPERVMRDETYAFKWVNADKMIFPDEGPDMGSWTWIAEEVTVTLEEAKEDERFPANLRNQFVPNSSARREELDRTGPDRPENKPDDLITYIEYWDIRKARRSIVVEGQTFSSTQFLVDEPIPEGVEDHPYAILAFNPVIAPFPSPWPTPHTATWLPIQNEIQERRQQMATGARRTARKVMYDDGVFADEDEAVRALQSNVDMESVKLASMERQPQVIADAPLPQSIVQDYLLLEQDWAQATGVSPARSGAGRSRNTATEAEFEQASGEARELEMRHFVNVWLEAAGRKMLQLMRGTLTLGVMVQLRGVTDESVLNFLAGRFGPEFAQQLASSPNVAMEFKQFFGSQRWMELTREELDFEADLQVAPGSSRPRNLQNEKQDFFQFMQLLSSVPILTQSRALLEGAAQMFEFIEPSMVDEIIRASERAQQIQAIQAGRLQGNDSRPAAEGGGANVTPLRRSLNA